MIIILVIGEAQRAEPRGLQGEYNNNDNDNTTTNNSKAIYVYIYIYILIYLSSNTCPTHMFFKSGE